MIQFILILLLGIPSHTFDQNSVERTNYFNLVKNLLIKNCNPVAYYSNKLHAVFSINGLFESVDLSHASVYDINYLKGKKTQISGCTLIEDRGYLSSGVQLNLFETLNIKLSTPMRSNLNVSNSAGIIENDYLPSSHDSLGDGNYNLGSNISRVFNF